MTERLRQRACWPTTGETATPNPNSPTPATATATTTPSTPDPNAALAAFVQQAVTQLDTIESGLGSDPPLTPAQKRHAAKLRKGGDKILPQIGNLVQQQQLESPALSISDMTTLLGKASALQPLANRVAAFGKHVDDVIFKAESDALVIAQQYYALLQRRAVTDTELAAALQPIADFFAYRHRTQKAPGTPTKRQRKATTKAVATLKKTAPQMLASQEASTPAAEPAPAAAPAAATPGNTTPTHS